jgi:hypothetical protein
MPRDPLEELLRLESMRKKPLERQYLQKRQEKLRGKYPVPKEFSLEKVHTSKT